MTLYAPEYYNNFKCIAGKCKHNCCTGWEIDIDENTYTYYKTLGGELGKRLSLNISDNVGTPHFILSDEERCPFLNKNNLCDIIIELGEKGLCDICNDHPRFRNYYDSRIEIGLGLCCEAAADLILSGKDFFKITEIKKELRSKELPDEEMFFFSFREKIITTLQNRKRTLKERVSEVLSVCSLKFPVKNLSQWIDIYLSLERLDSKWTALLNSIKTKPTYTISDEWEIVFEQLLIYFVYRHLAGSIYDGMLAERLIFSLLSCYIIYHICTLYKKLSFTDIVEVSRLYSSEIEYSDKNISVLLNILAE